MLEKYHNVFLGYSWYVEDGRHILDSSIEQVEWYGGYRAPYVIFREFKLPPEYTLYQERLRKEWFTLVYQTEEEKNKIYRIYNSFSNHVDDIEFINDYNSLKFLDGNIRQHRASQQEDFEHPLVGIWGRLPYLHEYRLVDPTGCQYYMEIHTEIPNWGVREGTYLLKQKDDRTFETVSSFPDGRFELYVRNSREILMTPLYSLPDDEEGILGVLNLSLGNRLGDPYYQTEGIY